MPRGASMCLHCMQPMCISPVTKKSHRMSPAWQYAACNQSSSHQSAYHHHSCNHTRSRQSQCGSAAPYHGRLGANTHWGDKVRVRDIRQWERSSSLGARITRPWLRVTRRLSLTTATHWRSGRDGMASQSQARVAPQVQSYSDVCTCG